MHGPGHTAALALANLAAITDEEVVGRVRAGEAYVRAYMHLDQFENRVKFPTWLTRIAVHEALARLRKSGRLESLDSEVDSETDMRPEPISNTRSPEEQLFGKQMQVLLEAAIDALPQAYRPVFVMREIEEISTAETAEGLGVTEEVIKTRLHRARALLQTDLYSRRLYLALRVEFHLSRCDRVVNAVLSRILRMSSSPNLLQ